MIISPKNSFAEVFLAGDKTLDDMLERKASKIMLKMFEDFRGKTNRSNIRQYALHRKWVYKEDLGQGGMTKKVEEVFQKLYSKVEMQLSLVGMSLSLLLDGGNTYKPSLESCLETNAYRIVLSSFVLPVAKKVVGKPPPRANRGRLPAPKMVYSSHLPERTYVSTDPKKKVE